MMLSPSPGSDHWHHDVTGLCRPRRPGPPAGRPWPPRRPRHGPPGPAARASESESGWQGVLVDSESRRLRLRRRPAAAGCGLGPPAGLSLRPGLRLHWQVHRAITEFAGSESLAATASSTETIMMPLPHVTSAA